MPRAELVTAEGVVGPCPSCGASGHMRRRLLTAKGRVAWDGCDFCWALAGRRGQLETLKALCRAADQDVPAPMRR